MAADQVADSFVASDVLESDDSGSTMNPSGAHAATNTSKGPTSFTLFPKLPVELRLKIRRYASFEQRNVDIWIGRMKLSGKGSRTRTPHFFYSTCPHPAVLHVSTEARSEAKQHYSLYFGAHAKSIGTMVISTPRIYVNRRADRLCIMDTRIMAFPEALNDLRQKVFEADPFYIALNTHAEEEEIQLWMNTLRDYVFNFVLFHHPPEPPKFGERGTVVFNSLDHKSLLSLPEETHYAYDYILGRVQSYGKWILARYPEYAIRGFEDDSEEESEEALEEDSEENLSLSMFYEVSVCELKWTTQVGLIQKT